jgi:Domain of unknown function (DUF4351)
MAQNSFDQLSKQYLEEFLAPIGQVIRNLEIPGEAKFVDVFFNPNPDVTIDPELGLLGRIIQTTCSLEPFRNPPSRHDIRTCLLKLIWIQEQERRKAKQTDQKFSEEQLPQLWVLASSVSRPVLNAFKAEERDDWPPGLYSCGEGFKTTIVAINQLPITDETLWLRLLGKGPTQEQAIRSVLALPSDHPRRGNILRLLASWHVRIDLGEFQEIPEQETIMVLSQAFLEWEQQTAFRAEEKGRQEGRQEGETLGQLTLLRSLLAQLLPQKLGPIPSSDQAIVDALNLAQLEALSLAFLRFSTIGDFEAWLATTLQSQLFQTWKQVLGKLSEPQKAIITTASLQQLADWIELGNSITADTLK